MDNGRLKLPIRKIDAGFDHTCAIDSRRRALCCGEYENGQVNGHDKNNYKLGEFNPEDFAMDLTQLGYYEE
jgi:hypothetical protein